MPNRPTASNEMTLNGAMILNYTTPLPIYQYSVNMPTNFETQNQPFTVPISVIPVIPSNQKEDEPPRYNNLNFDYHRYNEQNQASANTNTFPDSQTVIKNIS